MLKESKKTFVLVLLMSVNFANASSGQNLTFFGDTLDNKVIPNCYLRKEYNYFMNQWTTNEVCNPVVKEIAPKTIRLSNPNANVVDNVYLGPTTYYNTPYVYNGYYTGNNNAYSWNNWSGYGSASNYLLGSFGGGIGYNGYYNNYYPNSVFTYTPSVYSNYSNYNFNSWTSPSNYNWSNVSDSDAGYYWGIGYGYAAEKRAQGFNEQDIKYAAEEDLGVTW